MKCPTPGKKSFRSKAKASRYNREIDVPEKARLWPYLCQSGEHWHLTNQNFDEQKRIGEAIKGHLGQVQPIDTADTDQ